ncbi:hypothetical protein D3C79_921600 [compost metagenome]
MPGYVAIQRTNCLVKPHQATATEHGLGTDMADLPVDLLVDCRFARIAHRQVDMAALPRQGLPVLFAQAQQRTHPKASAWPDHQRWPRRVSLTRAHLAKLPFAQAGHAQRHGGEIVDQ